MSGSKHVSISPVANSVPFDNSTNGFVAEDVQTAIEEAKNLVEVSASPGFTWGNSGNVNSGSYLLNDTVPSNKAGRLVPITTGNITQVFVTNENNNTFSVTIQKRVGAVFTNLVTVSLTAQRLKVQTVSVPVILSDELCVKISAGSCKNPVVGLIIKGTV